MTQWGDGLSGASEPNFGSPGLESSTSSLRVPPNNHDAEKSVLGGLLLNNQALDEVSDLNLEPEDFYKEGHQLIFKAILDLNARGEAADTITVANTLRNSNSLPKAGGTQYLISLIEYEFSAANVAQYSKIVKQKAVLRKFITTSTNLIGQAYQGVDSQEDFLDQAEKEIFKVTNLKQSNNFSQIKDVLLKNFQQIEESAARKGEVVGITTGFSDLDRHTTGWHPGQLIIIAARPGMGKTSFMLNLAASCAATKKATAFFSMEMGDEELCMRALATQAKVDSYRLRTGRLQEDDWKNLTRAAGVLAELPIFFDDSPALNILEIRSRCRRIQSQNDLGLIIVDYLQLMRGLSKGNMMNREQEISEISRGLKALAKELNVPVIAASQLNRGVESRTDKRPMLSDLRESGAIEQDADMVVFIHRDEQYNKEASEHKGVAEIIIGKHRAGQVGTVKLGWIGQYTTFTNLAAEQV